MPTHGLSNGGGGSVEMRVGEWDERDTTKQSKLQWIAELSLPHYVAR